MPGVHRRSWDSSVTVLTRLEACVGLGLVAERMFRFGPGSNCTNQNLYKTFRAFLGHYFFAKKILPVATFILSWHRNLTISILNCDASWALSIGHTIRLRMNAVWWVQNCLRMVLGKWVQSGSRNKPRFDFLGDFHSCPSKKYFEIVSYTFGFRNTQVCAVPQTTKCHMFQSVVK